MSDWVPTTCMRCAVGCGHMQLGVDEGYGIDAVRGNGSHPVSQGMACSRGIEESADPGGKWLSQPLVRKGGELVAVSWHEALDRIEEKLTPLIENDPDSVAILGSGQQTNEAAYALGKLARGGIGTRNYDANTTLCMASAVTAYYQALGSDAPPCSYDDIPEASTHVIWGANPAVAHPVLYQWIRQSATEDDSRLVVVDPVRTATAESAHRHVQVDPGGDLPLARAILARIVGTGDIDREFVHRATDGFDELVTGLPPADVAAREAGVSPTTVEYLADIFTDQTLVYWGMGVNQSVRGTAVSRALIDLCLATGNLRPGSGPFSLTGQANSMGTRVVSSKGSWPGQRPFDDPDERELIADAWDVPVERLPDDAGPGPVGIVDAIEEGASDGSRDVGEVEAIYTVATNPASGLPDAGLATERLRDTFLIAQDVFHTETTDLADVVLPAITWGESEGTIINMERTVSRVRAATDTPDGVRSDLDIIAAIANRLCPGLLPEPPVDPAAIFDEFAALTAGTPADCSGISHERLDEELAVRWPAPEADAQGGYRYHTHDDQGDHWDFETDDGRARFSPPGLGDIDLPELTDEKYPLTLTTAREADGYNTGIRSRSVEDPDPARVRLNPSTLAAQFSRAADAEFLSVESRRGSLTARVEADPTIPEGMVWLPIHHPDTNDLTLPETDPQSDEPNYKQCAVRIEPVDSSASEAEHAIERNDDEVTA